MLGLPSTTEVNRRLPKETFYRNIKVTSAVKQDFIDRVERFTVCNSIKPSTTNIPEGQSVPEVLVLQVELRQREVPRVVIDLIAETNPHKLLFVCVFGNEACLAVRLKRLVAGEWVRLDELTLDLRSDSMDAFWDSLASQVAYGDKGVGENGGPTVEERFAFDEKIRTLRGEAARIDARMRREKQFAKKNELLRKLGEINAQINALEQLSKTSR